jgi:hypothetical protein
MMSLYCTARNDDVAYRIVEELQVTGYPAVDISLVVHDLNFIGFGPADACTCAIAGSPDRRCAADLLCGALGCFGDIDSVPIPGIGPLIVAGPLLAPLSLAAIDSSSGGIAGALINEGVPPFKARTLEGDLRDGCFLLAVETFAARDANHIMSIFVKEGAGYAVSISKPMLRPPMKARQAPIQHSR